jgi:hypothetical protein
MSAYKYNRTTRVGLHNERVLYFDTSISMPSMEYGIHKTHANIHFPTILI